MKGGLRSRGKHKRSLLEAPLVSIVTVVFNGEKTLEQAILSVLNQEYGNVEYIVVDGGSTDGTFDIIRKYDERIDYWISEPDNGIYDAMNKGIELSQGEMIGTLNADDYYQPDAVSEVVKAWTRDRPQGIIYGQNYVIMDDIGLRYRNYARLSFWKGMPVCHQAMFVHRKVYESVGKYDLTYKITADLDFLLRAINKGVELLAVDKFLVNFRSTGMSTDNTYRLLEEIRTILKHHFGLFSPTFVAFLSFYCRKIVLLVLRSMLYATFGDSFMLKARRLYARTFIFKRKDSV
jgi:glycosyltransferase involved in cell wall biosynthesis